MWCVSILKVWRGRCICLRCKRSTRSIICADPSRQVNANLCTGSASLDTTSVAGDQSGHRSRFVPTPRVSSDWLVRSSAVPLSACHFSPPQHHRRTHPETVNSYPVIEPSHSGSFATDRPAEPHRWIVLLSVTMPVLVYGIFLNLFLNAR